MLRSRILLRSCFALTWLLWGLGAAAAPLTLLVIGDTGDCDTGGAAQVSAALRAQPDWQRAWLIEVGDLAYPVATRERLVECHEPYFGMFPRRLAVPGNHDWYDPGARGFFSLFPDSVPRAVVLDERWMLWLLDSNLEDEAWDAQLHWVNDTANEMAGRCVIAAWHHPRWSSGRRGGSVFVDPLWQRVAGVTALTLHGHDHQYEALAPRDGAGNIDPAGARAFIVGNGGAKLHPGGELLEKSKAVFGRWGFLRLDLDGEDYRWQAIDVDGATIDAGIGHCRPLHAASAS